MSTTANAAHKKLTQRAAIGAALSNEQITRERVLNLEKQAQELDIRAKAAQLRLDHYGDLLQPFSRGFLGRLKWVFTGK